MNLKLTAAYRDADLPPHPARTPDDPTTFDAMIAGTSDAVGMTIPWESL